MQAKFLQWTNTNILDLSPESDIFEVQEPKITIPELSFLKEFLYANPMITVLNIQGCKLGDQVTEIFDKDAKIKSLIIGGNNITYAGWKNLSKIQSLTHMDVSYSALTDTQAKEFCRAFQKNKSITYLDLFINLIGDEGAIAVAELCSFNPSLKKIDIHGNLIGEEGARALTDILINKPALEIVCALQSGSRLPACKVATVDQWKILSQKVQDPQEQAACERKSGLHPEIPSLASLSVFAVERNVTINLLRKNEVIENGDVSNSKP